MFYNRLGHTQMHLKFNVKKKITRKQYTNAKCPFIMVSTIRLF